MCARSHSYAHWMVHEAFAIAVKVTLQLACLLADGAKQWTVPVVAFTALEKT